MMKRKNLYALFSCLFLSGCGMIDYHPYDVRISGETEVNAHNIERIEANCLGMFAPHAFAPQCQLQTRKSPSPPVFLHISTHFTATRGIPLSSSALKSPSFQCNSTVKP